MTMSARPEGSSLKVNNTAFCRSWDGGCAMAVLRTGVEGVSCLGRVDGMGSIEEREAALALAAQAQDVVWAADGTPWERFLRTISSGIGTARLEGARREPRRRCRLRCRLHRLRPLRARVGRVALHHGEVPAVRAGHRGPGGAAPRAPRSVLAHPGRPLPGLSGLLGDCGRGRARELSAARDLPARARRVSLPGLHADRPAGRCQRG
jgi:hypothetical protein